MSNHTEESIHIRRVTQADKRVVLDIRNVYDGTDYLEAFYDHFISLPDIYPAAIFCGEKIAGFAFAHIVDHGRTAVIRAARVSPDYEGKGLMKVLIRHVARWACQNGVDSVLSTEDEQPESNTIGPQRSILTWNYLLLSLESQNIHGDTDDLSVTPDLETVSDQHLIGLFNDSRIRDYIAPEGTLLVNWVPLKPLEHNIPYIRGTEGSAKIYSDLKLNESDHSGLLSFGTQYRAPLGSNFSIVLVLDLHGNDTLSIRKHLIRHLADIMDSSDNKFAVYVTIPPGMDFSEINETLKQYYVQLESDTNKPVCLHLLEWWKRK